MRCLADIDIDLARKRTVVAHPGQGASLCALQNGRSLDTTMGFSAPDGLVMGTRCGAIDPGVLLYLLKARGLGADDIEHLLYHQSGLLGVSGLSADMRILEASGDPHAKQAIELFVFHIARETAALANTLGGLDLFVFTGKTANTRRQSARPSASACPGSVYRSSPTATSARPIASTPATAPWRSGSSPQMRRSSSHAKSLPVALVLDM